MTGEAVSVATLVERRDLGPGRFTVVAAGDPVPAPLADLPRVPRDGEDKPKRRARKG